MSNLFEASEFQLMFSGDFEFWTRLVHVNFGIELFI